MKPIPGLQDIQGLDTFGVWPLAIGWWLLIGIFIIIIGTPIFNYVRMQIKLRTWQHHILKQLETLDKTLSPENVHEAAARLAVLVRRLAIHRYSRTECANLKGEEWLGWLTSHDPKKFNWQIKARSLIEAPYAPQTNSFDQDSLKQTIGAAKGWVK